MLFIIKITLFLHAYIRIEFAWSLQTLTEEVTSQVKAAKQWVPPAWAPSCAKRWLRKRSRTRQDSGRGRPCLRDKHSLRLRELEPCQWWSRNIHNDYKGKVDWVNAQWIWIRYSLLCIKWYSFHIYYLFNKIGSLAIDYHFRMVRGRIYKWLSH
jgi:hypothetical protein